MNKVVCVLGMHRSGTSMLSNWINLCGLDLGDELLRADFSNETGHFEDLDFLHLHKEILSEHDLDTSGLFLDAIPTLSSAQRQKIRHLVEKRNAASPQWGWKDPRTCIFVDEYLEIIPDLFLITIIRDHTSSIQSLLNRDVLRIKESQYGGIRGSLKWPFAKNKIVEEVINNNLACYTATISLYYKNILNALGRKNGDTRLVITIDDLLTRDNAIYSHLAEKFALDIKLVPFDHVYKKSGRRRVEVSSRQIPQNKELDDLQKRLLKLKTVFE